MRTYDWRGQTYPSGSDAPMPVVDGAAVLESPAEWVPIPRGGHPAGAWPAFRAALEVARYLA